MGTKKKGSKVGARTKWTSTQKSIKAQKIWLEKADSTKAAKPGLGLPLLKLKIHMEVSKHITI